ncbi:hypothetical protein PRIPAC_81278 [Pristionchus pacificus]|uniref:G protein-coupled receptor n=1 Tax=Pristionchus pacificus TaxID=54126 RepID=A0A2A6C2Z6_PRIPA|nr:hypothetical protein PRIPAC_81278 [Pristionchus pacificus]|eukprot:PDM72477.1 G protein-coupled receptor [Pristionchus pacificus]
MARPDPPITVVKQSAAIINWYTGINYGLTIASFFIDSLVVYLIINFTPRTSVGYRKHLLMVKGVGISTTLYLCLMFQPVTTAPLSCIYAMGLIQSAVHLDTHLSFTIFVCAVALNAPPLANCFLYRHQCIMMGNSRFKFSERLLIPVRIFVYLYFLCHGIAVYLMRYPSDGQDRFVNGKLRGFTEEEKSRIACYDMQKFKIFLLVVCFTCGICLLLIFLICYHIFRVLHTHQALSEKTREYHKSMTRSLIIQSTMIAVNVIGPLFVYFIQFSFEFRSDAYSLIAFEVISTYSAIFGILLVLQTPSYRNGIRSFFLSRSHREAIEVQTAPKSPSTITPHKWSG